MEREYIDLLTLQKKVKEGLTELFPEKLWVKAEIAQWAPRQNGHCYLSLSQSRGGTSVAEAKAVIWRGNCEVLSHFFEQETGSPLRSGITVLVRVQVSFHEVYGYSLVIDDIDPAFTVGEMALERRRTLEKLGAEGYLELQRELGLPRLPGRLAVISARTAAGYGDFCNHLLHNTYGFHFSVTLFEALMQGDAAPVSIVEALSRIRESGEPFDAVLLLRGGGSELDLACFDDYGLAVAIATYELPVFTAIGHDKDVHVADLVAHRSVKTPTALADLFLDCYIAEDEQIGALALRIRRGLARRLSESERSLDAAVSRVRFAASARHAAALSRIELLEEKIAATDPRSILSRGFVLVEGPDGKRLRSASRVQVGERITLRLGDGRLRAAVQQVEPDTASNTA